LAQIYIFKKLKSRENDIKMNYSIYKYYKKETLKKVSEESTGIQIFWLSAFHSKCDDVKSFLVLVETGKGKRYGGFTTCSWSGDYIDKKD